MSETRDEKIEAARREQKRRADAYPGLIAVLRRIAKPALGGKLQQYAAQDALRKLGESVE